MDYQYTGHNSNKTNSSSSSNLLEETYHVEPVIAILNPHLLNISLSGDVFFQQVANSNDTAGTSTGNNARYQYTMDASFLDRSWHPVNVFSLLVQETVVVPFSPTLNSEISRNGFDCSFLLDPFRARFRYERNTLDLTGGNFHSSSISDLFHSSGSYSFRDINFLSLDFGLFASESEGSAISQTTNGYSLGFTDTLYWGRTRNYSLASEFQLQNTTSAGLPQKSVNVNETFLAHLGRALDGQIDYRYASNRTAVLSGQDQLFETNALTAQLRHQLFQSLDTRLRGTLSQSTTTGATEDRYAGLVGMKYRKSLNPLSQLTLDVSLEHEVTDRKGVATDLQVRNEPHTVTQANDIILLLIAGPLEPGSVTVQGFSVPPANAQIPPDKIFIEGIDYTVDYALGRINWGPIVPSVPAILISYTSRLDPSVKYSTDTMNLGGTLSLQNGHYLLSGFLYTQDRQQISGQSQNGLYQSRVGILRFQGFAENQNYSLQYTDYVAGPSKYRYVEGSWRYIRQGPRSSLQSQVTDRYTMYEAAGATAGYAHNSLNTSASWTRDLFGTAQLLLSLNFIDERGGRALASDNIFLRATLRARFNKFTASLYGSSGWRIFGTSQERDDYVRLEVKRFF